MTDNWIPPSRPTPDQLAAIRTLLEYLTRSSNKVDTSEILRGTGLDNDDYQNFRRATSSKQYGVIAKFLRERLKTAGRIPDCIKPLIRECLPEMPSGKSDPIKTPDDIFFKYADRTEDTLRNISDVYSGLYNVYRYSSHIERKPRQLLTETSPDGRSFQDDPWMIHSAMEIISAAQGDEFVRFKIYYRPYERLTGSLATIEGIVIPIKELLYFVGLEDTRYPVIIMAFQHTKKLEMFNGMIMRYHEFQRTIASRIGFKRAPGNIKSMDDLQAKVGLETESEILDEIADFENALINSVEYRGKAALVATGRP